jgi:hypothetical protein
MLFNSAIEMGRLNRRALMVDLDAQANLTAIALDDSVLDALYPLRFPHGLKETMAQRWSTATGARLG